MKDKPLIIKCTFVLIILSISIYLFFEYSSQDVLAKMDTNALFLQSTPTQASDPDNGDDYFISIYAPEEIHRTITVSSSTNITLRVVWVADTIARVQYFYDVTQFTTFLDGVALPDSGDLYGPIVGVGDFDGDGDGDYTKFYSYDLGTLSPGVYTARLIYSISSPVVDGFDGIGCGPPIGCWGDGDSFITIIVELAVDTPTPTPTITPTPTLTSISIPSPTNTSSPAAIFQAIKPGIINSPFDPPEEEYFNDQYRDSGPYVPEFTTNIPSPLDISLEPEVIGTNIFLAVLLMIPLAYSNELLSLMLEEFEKKHLENKKAPRRFKLLGGWLGKTIALNQEGRVVFKDMLRILILIIIYGLIFSMLDSSWKPFTREGVLLFISMAVIFGVVGMLDDFIQWRMIKKWKLPINLEFKPLNLLMAAISIVVSRFLFLIPGIMFGTPELLQTTEKGVPEPKQKHLLKTSMITFTVIGSIAWILTLFTRIILLDPPVNPLMNMEIVAGIEAFLLIIFAVIIENYFIQMLGLPGSFGRLLKRSNSKLWFVLLILIAFILIHTLINPQGDLMNALQKGNVIVFIGVVGIFVVGVLSAYAFRWLLKGRKNKKG